MQTLADSGCLVLWTGEQGVRFYAQGMGETRAARNLLKQSWLCSRDALRLRVVRRMYDMRFTETLEENLTLQQIRGKEGVREAYAQASRDTGVDGARLPPRALGGRRPCQSLSLGSKQLSLRHLPGCNCLRRLLARSRLHPHRQNALVRL